MIDPEELKERYKAMSDEAIVHFAVNEGDRLTQSAFSILRDEFSRRQLPSDVLQKIQDGTHSAAQRQVKKMLTTIPQQETKTFISIALNDKRDGKNDAEIISNLMQLGLDEVESRVISNNIFSETKLREGKAKHAMLTSVFAFCAGVALFLISPYNPTIGFLDVMAGSSVFFGALIFLFSFLEYKKCKTILHNLSGEQLAPFSKHITLPEPKAAVDTVYLKQKKHEMENAKNAEETNDHKVDKGIQPQSDDRVPGQGNSSNGLTRRLGADVEARGIKEQEKLKDGEGNGEEERPREGSQGMSKGQRSDL